MRTRSKRRGPPAAERIAVEYPHEGEVIPSSGCAFEIDAPDRSVAIAIDGGGWSSCRRSDGRWRYDWTCPEPGWHQALVLCEAAGGGEPALRVVRFRVGGAAS